MTLWRCILHHWLKPNYRPQSKSVIIIGGGRGKMFWCITFLLLPPLTFLEARRLWGHVWKQLEIAGNTVDPVWWKRPSFWRDNVLRQAGIGGLCSRKWRHARDRTVTVTMSCNVICNAWRHKKFNVLWVRRETSDSQPAMYSGNRISVSCFRDNETYVGHDVVSWCDRLCYQQDDTCLRHYHVNFTVRS